MLPNCDAKAYDALERHIDQLMTEKKMLDVHEATATLRAKCGRP